MSDALDPVANPLDEAIAAALDHLDPRVRRMVQTRKGRYHVTHGAAHSLLEVVSGIGRQLDLAVGRCRECAMLRLAPSNSPAFGQRCSPCLDAHETIDTLWRDMVRAAALLKVCGDAEQFDA